MPSLRAYGRQTVTLRRETEDPHLYTVYWEDGTRTAFSAIRDLEVLGTAETEEWARRTVYPFSRLSMDLLPPTTTTNGGRGQMVMVRPPITDYLRQLATEPPPIPTCRVSHPHPHPHK